jgi:hypothetical protein
MTTPRGVATDAAGNLYVADQGNNRIQKFQDPNSPCTGSGLQITNQGASPSTGTAGHSYTGSFTVSVQNCTGGDLSKVKLQGGSAGWLTVTSATATQGTTSISTKKKNTAQVVTANLGTLTNGGTASVTVNATGTVPNGAACGSNLPISGSWSATGLDASNNSISSGRSGVATISITCP